MNEKTEVFEFQWTSTVFIIVLNENSWITSIKHTELMSFFFCTYTPYTDTEWLTRLEQGSIFEKCWVKRSAVTLSRGLRGGQLYERGSGILTSPLSSQTLGSVSQRRQLYRTSNNSEGVTFIRLKFEMHLSHRKVTHCLSSRIPLSIYSLLLYCTARTTHVVIYTLSG